MNTTEKKFSEHSAKLNTPEKKFRVGAICATIWKNNAVTKDGKESSFRTVSIERSYKDKNDEWQNTNSMRAMDLPKLVLVLNKAYEYVSFADNGPVEA